MDLEALKKALASFFQELYLDPGSPTGTAFLPLYFLVCLFTFALLQRRQPQQGPLARRFLSYLLPKSVYLHPSARLDFKMLLTNGVVAVAAGLLGFTSGFRFTAFLGSLHRESLNGTMHLLTQPHPFPGLFQFTGFWPNLCLTIAMAMARDLGRVLVHYPMHKVPFLWEIHKVHHSAEVLTPFTAYRLHPIEMALSSLSSGACNGACLCFFLYLFGPGKLSLVTLFGISVVRIISNMTGVFEHNNKWFSLGRIGFVFANPAGHLVHHSVELRHRDKNFSNHFAIFDLILGTLYIPKHEEHFRIGVRDGTGRPFVSRSLVRDFYLQPLVDVSYALLRRTPPAPRPAGPTPPELHCWCGPNCPVLADAARDAAQPRDAWTCVGDLMGYSQPRAAPASGLARASTHDSR